MAKVENKVEIVPNDQGAKIRVSVNNPEYAHVLLVQNKTWIAPSGWVRQRRMSTLLNGKTELIQELGLNKKKYLPGQIVIKEQLEPFSCSSDGDRDIKYAGDTGVICCKDGEIIYRKCFYDASGIDTDVFVQHTNGDAIREANAARAEENNVTMDDDASMINGEEFFTKNEETDPAQIDLEDSIAEVEATENHNEEDGETTETKVVEAAEEEEIEEEEEELVEIEEDEEDIETFEK
jgi:hypothetical protein